MKRQKGNGDELVDEVLADVRQQHFLICKFVYLYLFQLLNDDKYLFCDVVRKLE